MSKKTTEESFLENHVSARTPVAIYLVTGICLRGVLLAQTSQDSHVLFLKSHSGGSIQMVFKTAISTISSDPAHSAVQSWG